MRVVPVLLLLCALTGSAAAGRSQYGWLYGAEVLPEKSVEIQQWVYERNGLVDDTTKDTAMWWGVLVGITDQLELVIPIELLWRRVNGAGSDPTTTDFTIETYGAEVRYRFNKLDSENPDGFAVATVLEPSQPQFCGAMGGEPGGAFTRGTGTRVPA